MKDLVKKIMVMLLCITMTVGVLPPLAAGAFTVSQKEEEDVSFPAQQLSVAEVTAFERLNPMSKTMAGVLLTDLTSGEIIAAKNSTMLTSSSELSEWLFLLCALQNADPEEEITITKAMLDHAKRAEYPVLIGLQEKDTVTVENLLLMFLMTRADDVRAALATAMAGTEKKAVEQMNRLAEQLKLKDTKIVATDGAYVSGQHTNAYDLYVVIRELLPMSCF